MISALVELFADGLGVLYDALLRRKNRRRMDDFRRARQLRRSSAKR
jgi:hypothetical protein